MCIKLYPQLPRTLTTQPEISFYDSDINTPSNFIAWVSKNDAILTNIIIAKPAATRCSEIENSTFRFCQQRQCQFQGGVNTNNKARAALKHHFSQEPDDHFP